MYCRAIRGMEVAVGDVRDGLEEALKVAGLAKIDAGAVAAARALADKIDVSDETGTFDNTSFPTFLRYCEALGLTPSGRVKLDTSKKPEAGSGGRLGRPSSIPRPT